MENKEHKISPLKLALIITGSVVAAAGIVLLILKLVKKSKANKALDCCDCCDCGDEWFDGDEDLLGDLRFDDDADASDDITDAVDEAIEAVTE